MKIFEKNIVRQIKQPYGSAVINHKGKVVFLNNTASIIYENHLKKKNTFEIASILAEEYNIPKEELINDVSTFIEYQSIHSSLNS